MISKNRFGIVILFFLVFAISVTALSPIIWIEERGNVTEAYSSIVTGNLTLETGFQYNSFIAILGNFSYFNQSILSNESLFLEWNRTFDIPGLDEGFKFFRNRSLLKLGYNISNNFDSDASYIMNVSLPLGCTDFNYELNDTVNSINFYPGFALLEYDLLQGSSLLLNISCNITQVAGNITSSGAFYNISVRHVVKDYDINILPKSYLSLEKEPYNRANNNVLYPNETWRIGFNFFNEDPISIEITDINLWAIPINLVTDDPAENRIHDVHFDTCANLPSNILGQDDVCIQETFFNTTVVPTVWSDLEYQTLWDYRINSSYYFNGQDYSFDLDAPFVILLSPPNASYQDFDVDINLTFRPNVTSQCDLFTNITGVWGINQTVNASPDNGSFILHTPDNATTFIWNVFCVALNGANTGFAKANWTISTNALPRQYQNISNLTWIEDTSYSIDIDDYFIDPDGDDMNYSYQPDPVLNFTILVDNATGNITFIPDPNFFGERPIRIVVHDPYNRTVLSNLFFLNVTNTPDAPKIIFWNITNGVWWTTNETNLNASEGENLTFTAEGFDVDLLANESVPDTWFYWFLDGILQSIGKVWTWSIDFFSQGLRNVTLVLNDSDNLSDSQSWLINVTNVNIAPISITIPEQKWKENTTLVVNLSTWFFDHDPGDEHLNYTYTGNLQNLTVFINQSTSMMYITPDIGFQGIRARWMQLTANDSVGHINVSNLFNLTVFPWIIKQLPNVTFWEDSWNDSINLMNYYNTINYTYGNLSWGTNSSLNLNFMLGSNGTLNISAAPDWFGNESVSMLVYYVYGIDNWNDSSVFEVRVLPVNDPSEINGTSRLILENSTPPNNWVDLWNYSFDVDNTYLELNYTILSQSNPGLVNCSILGDRYVNCSAPALSAFGINLVNVSVSDGEYNDSAIFEFIVFHDNYPPVILNWNVTNRDFFYTDADGIYDFTIDEGTYLNFSISYYDYENDVVNHTWFIRTGFPDVYSNLQNPNLYFGFNSSGFHILNYTINQSQGLQASLEWNVTVNNVNRPPTKVDLLRPENNSFRNVPFRFNWTSSVDYDAIGHNGDDYWDFVYVLQADNNPDFFTPEIDLQLSNATFYDLDIALADDIYYWRVVTYDGLDASVSEVFKFTYDVNVPEYEFIISPNPAEFGIRNVDINWTVTDKFLNISYVNISYPNGTFIGQFFSNLTLTPAELTLQGNYPVTLYINDYGDHTILVYDNLLVINDAVAPIIRLINPSDNSVIRTQTSLFSYEYDDLNTLANCSLFMQKMNIIYDVVGGIMYAEEAGPWQVVSVDTSIQTGVNYFVVNGLDEDSYAWNVGCYDLAGNYGFAEENNTFRVILQESPPLYVYPEPSEPVPIGELTVGGYSLKAKIYPVRSNTGELVSGKLEIYNTGASGIYDLSFLGSYEWLYFKDSLAYIGPGEKVNVTFDIYSPYYPGEYVYHVVLFTENFKLLVPGSLHVNEPVKLPFQIVKLVQVKDNYYNITLSLTNYLSRSINFYLEDSIDSMTDIIYRPNEFDAKPFEPAQLALKRYSLAGKESINVSYTSRKLDLSKITVPTIITDEKYDVDLVIVYPHEFNILQFRQSPVELILVISFLVIFLILVLYYFVLKLRRKYFL